MESRFTRAAMTLIAILTLFVPTALAQTGADSGGRSLSASGAAAAGPAGGYSLGPMIDSVPVPDGGFENGPPPSSLWTEYSNNTCEWILDPTSIWGIPAHSGTYAFWAGGYCGSDNTDRVEQIVTVPSEETTLTFYAVYWRVDQDDIRTDRFYVAVNGQRLFKKPMLRANDTYPNWVLESVDLSAYAGQEVLLAFGAQSRGGLTGNVLVDDIAFAAP